MDWTWTLIWFLDFLFAWSFFGQKQLTERHLQLIYPGCPFHRVIPGFMCQAKCWQNELNGTQLGWWTNKTHVGNKYIQRQKRPKRFFQEIIGLFIISTGARVLTQLVTVECWSGRRLHQYEWNRWTKHLWFQPLSFALVSGTTCWAQHLSPGNKFEDENFEWQSQTNRDFDLFPRGIVVAVTESIGKHYKMYLSVICRVWLF